MSTKKSGTSWQDTISDWLVSIIVAVALAFCIRTFVVEPYMVEGTSMYPTLESHERLIVSKYKYFFTEPKKGEIVVFRYPKDAAILSNALSRPAVILLRCVTVRFWSTAV